MYYLPHNDDRPPPLWQQKRIISVFLALVICSCSLFINVPKTRDTSNASIPQVGALNHLTRLPLAARDQPGLKGWTLTFHDEFNEPTLNTSVWNIEDYGKYRYQNCCLYFGAQYFTARALFLRDRGLHITSDKELSNKEHAGNIYTSGAITTENKFSFLYGRVDISARFPMGQGMWPGLWLLTANADHEVDIMEMVNDPKLVYQTYHLNTPLYNTAVPQCLITKQNLAHAFHVFSLIWNPSSLTWYIDGRQTCHIVNAFPKTPMYLLLDAAVGGDLPGLPNRSTTFPQSTIIDYVRVYQASRTSPCSGLQVSSLLHLAYTTIAFGSPISGTVTYTNRCTLPFVFLDLLIAARTITNSNADFGNKGPMTLQPGQSVTIDASRVINNKKLIGPGYAFSSFETADGKWHSDGTNLVKFMVTN